MYSLGKMSTVYCQVKKQMVECIVWSHFLKNVYVYRAICWYSIFQKAEGMHKKVLGICEVLTFRIFLNFSNILCEYALIF